MTHANDIGTRTGAIAPDLRPAGTSQPALSFQNVSKEFAAADGTRLEVLRGVSFDVPVGEIVAIIGPSGAGKSTLLNLAAGLIAPDRGSIKVMGQDTRSPMDWRCVGYMFQDDRLLPWRIAVRNVALALEVGAMPAAERLRRAQDALELVGLGQFANAYPHELSGGMRSRVALARSLVGEPRILLMDEPFSRLDAQTRGSMQREVLRIQDMRHVSILFVTHDVEEAVILADRIVLLSPRPARVRRNIPVSIPQPRIGTGAAVALTAELRASLEADTIEEISA